MSGTVLACWAYPRQILTRALWEAPSSCERPLFAAASSSSSEVCMFRWFQALMPREDRFFDLFNRHAETLVKGATALREVLKGGPGVADAAQQVFAFEVEADTIASNVLVLARRTFI